jgi:hypothetical protein
VASVREWRETRRTRRRDSGLFIAVTREDFFGNSGCFSLFLRGMKEQDEGCDREAMGVV